MPCHSHSLYSICQCCALLWNDDKEKINLFTLFLFSVFVSFPTRSRSFGSVLLSQCLCAAIGAIDGVRCHIFACKMTRFSARFVCDERKVEYLNWWIRTIHGLIRFRMMKFSTPVLLRQLRVPIIFQPRFLFGSCKWLEILFSVH